MKKTALALFAVLLIHANFAATLQLVSPNGGESWEVGKSTVISWESIGNDSLTVQYTADDGLNWNTLKKVPASDSKYTWLVPNTVSGLCKVRLLSSETTVSSDSVFNIIPNEGKTFRIVVLGSSTAAGTGPTTVDSAWVWRYRAYLAKLDTRYDVQNLAMGGYTTYRILPTGSATVSNQPIDVNRNITKAITLNPNGIIINMPSNDANNGFSVEVQIANYRKILEDAGIANVPVWITTPQPKYFSDSNKLRIQLDMLAQTPLEFGNDSVLDFWTGFAVQGGNGIVSQYNVDGTHLNNAAHKILFERVVAKNIHTQIKNKTINGVAYFKNNTSSFKIFPNVGNNSFCVNFSLTEPEDVTLSLYNFNGQKVSELMNEKINHGNYTIDFNGRNFGNGVFICVLVTPKGCATQKLILH